jgi:molybdenum cofactor guanylyltransferase
MEGRLFEGFVLTGGQSSRMGRDKALLPFDGATLLEQIAARVRAAAGSVTLIGSPERYAGLGLPVAADLIEGCGPIGGVYTALKISQAPWNLIVACDMPAVTTGFLAGLLEAARDTDAECLAPETGAGRHPLCAVYHRRALMALQCAIDHKSFKMHDLLSSIRTVSWPAADASLLENVNTPVEWGAR